MARSRRLAAITNFADLAAPQAPRSRGELTHGFLTGTGTAADFAGSISCSAYRGFNLLLWDGSELVYIANHGAHAGEPQRLRPGLYGLANAGLDDPWPKVTVSCSALRSRLRVAAGATGPPPAGGDPPGHGHRPDVADVLDVLEKVMADDRVPPDHSLPQRGMPLALERRVGPCFIRGTAYGTRATTALLVERDGAHLREQSFGPLGAPGARTQSTLRFAAGAAT